MKYNHLILVSAILILGACAKDGNDDSVGGGKIQKTVDRLVYVVDNQGTPYVAPAYDTAAARKGFVWRAEGLHKAGQQLLLTREYDSAEYHITEMTWGLLPYCVTLTFSDSTHCHADVVKNNHSRAGYLALFCDNNQDYVFLFHKNGHIDGVGDDNNVYDYVETLLPENLPFRQKNFRLDSITGSSVTAHPFDGLDDEGIEFFQFKRIDPDAYVSEYE